MTLTLGDFLIIAGQRIAAAEQHRDPLTAAAHAEVTTELDRLLTVMAQYACDGLNPAGPAQTSLFPTKQELTIIGIRLTLLHATESIHRIAHRQQTALAPATRQPRTCAPPPTPWSRAATWSTPTIPAPHTPEAIRSGHQRWTHARSPQR
jgi:hypothetical protein